MSGRSAGRGSAAASAIRLALRSLSIVATSSASLRRGVWRCFGSRRANSASIAAATAAIPPIPDPSQTMTGRFHHPLGLPSKGN
jgi:hypothetical protein